MPASPSSLSTAEPAAAGSLRYERKARITELTHSALEHLVCTHPALFREIYHERQINNVYFDTFALTSFEENISGIENRAKLRVRWYGDLLGRAEKAILEIKFKTNQVGGKRRFTLSSWELETPFEGRQLIRRLSRQDLPGPVRASLAGQEPRLLNRYSRRYFQSADGRFRLTLDRHLDYYRLHQGPNLLLQKFSESDAVVVELKYGVADDRRADELCGPFPFLWTKNSKYVTGIERLWWPDSS